MSLVDQAWLSYVVGGVIFIAFALGCAIGFGAGRRWEQALQRKAWNRFTAKLFSSTTGTEKASLILTDAQGPQWSLVRPKEMN